MKCGKELGKLNADYRTSLLPQDSYNITPIPKWNSPTGSLDPKELYKPNITSSAAYQPPELGIGMGYASQAASVSSQYARQKAAFVYTNVSGN